MMLACSCQLAAGLAAIGWLVALVLAYALEQRRGPR